MLVLLELINTITDGVTPGVGIVETEKWVLGYLEQAYLAWSFPAG
jgi:hypothetical protein